MNGAPLLQLQNAELIHRAYNIGLKFVPNLVGQMTVAQLEYFEANQPELANAASRALHIKNGVSFKRQGFHGSA